MRSARQELRYYAEAGNLRQQVEGKLSLAAADLLVNVVIRYCEPRQPSMWKRLAARAKAAERQP